MDARPPLPRSGGCGSEPALAPLRSEDQYGRPRAKQSKVRAFPLPPSKGRRGSHAGCKVRLTQASPAPVSSRHTASLHRQPLRGSPAHSKPKLRLRTSTRLRITAQHFYEAAYYKAILSARDHATKQVLAGRHDHDRYKSTTVCSPTAIHFHRLAAHHTCND